MKIAPILWYNKITPSNKPKYRRGANLMIKQINQNDHTPNQFSDAMRQLEIGKRLRKSNMTKSCGVSAYEVFRFLLLLAFQGKNLFRFLNCKHKEQAVSKNTYYRFLNKTSYNWSKFVLLLAVKVTSAFRY